MPGAIAGDVTVSLFEHAGIRGKDFKLFDLLNDDDKVIGQALRSACHGDPGLIHRAVHVLVFNSSGALLLQKRAPGKYIQPGKWDTSVGGHLALGES